MREKIYDWKIVCFFSASRKKENISLVRVVLGFRIETDAENIYVALTEYSVLALHLLFDTLRWILLGTICRCCFSFDRKVFFNELLKTSF